MPIVRIQRTIEKCRVITVRYMRKIMGNFRENLLRIYENAEKSKVLFLANPQIDWNAMYQANQDPILDS